MKLLLDENLSDRIIHRISDLYPDSEHVKTPGLINTDDAVIWEYAKTNSNQEVNKKEIEYILLFRSNDPSIGYNQRPKFNG